MCFFIKQAETIKLFFSHERRENLNASNTSRAYVSSIVSTFWMSSKDAGDVPASRCTVCQYRSVDQGTALTFLVRCRREFVLPSSPNNFVASRPKAQMSRRRPATTNNQVQFVILGSGLGLNGVRTQRSGPRFWIDCRPRDRCLGPTRIGDLTIPRQSVASASHQIRTKPYQNSSPTG